MNNLSSAFDTLSSAIFFPTTARGNQRERSTGYHDDMPSWRDNVVWFETYSSNNGAERINPAWENYSTINQKGLLTQVESPLVNSFTLERRFDISFGRLTLISMRARASEASSRALITNGSYPKWLRSLNPDFWADICFALSLKH